MPLLNSFWDEFRGFESPFKAVIDCSLSFTFEQMSKDLDPFQQYFEDIFESIGIGVYFGVQFYNV